MQSKKKWFVVFILLAALAGAAFYFLYFIRTPAYALNEARVALQQHDSGHGIGGIANAYSYVRKLSEELA